MKSRISIDVDYDNQPIIRIEYRESEDVRDKLVLKFLGTFGADVCWAKFQYNEYDPRVGKEAQIRPICAYDLPEEAKVMKVFADRHQEMRDALERDFPTPSEPLPK